jgi:4'-phosphopantetheinyl transferase
VSVSFPPPPPGVVRVWLASLDAPPVPAAQLAATLAPDERARAARFVFAHDRARYHAGRGLLRVILGAATGLPPEAVRLAAGDNGRPRLAGDDTGGAMPLSFNVSHSADRIAIALATGDAALALGVDIEWPRVIPELDDVAARVFDDVERARLAAAGDGERRLAHFHRLWTRKEACMKATGAGFALPPHTFRADADAAVQQVTLPAHDHARRGIVVTVHALPDAGGCVGAVAVAGAAWTVDVVPVD